MSRRNRPAADQFNPHSHNAMFAKILAQLEADRKERETDNTDRAEFRVAILERFDDGTERMERIEAQVTKTNGRVTKLEAKWKIVVAKISGAILIITALARALLWLYDHGWRVTGGG